MLYSCALCLINPDPRYPPRAPAPLQILAAEADALQASLAREKAGREVALTQGQTQLEDEVGRMGRMGCMGCMG